MASGYACSSIYLSNGINAAAWTDRIFDAGSSAATLASGLITLISGGSNVWIQNSLVCRQGDNATQCGSGIVPLGGALTGLRLSTNGADTFDAGSVTVLIEG